MSRKKLTIDIQFSARLTDLINALAISQTTFAQTIGISQSYLNMVIKGKRGPSAELIAGIFIHYREYLEWLLTGEGHPPWITTTTQVKTQSFTKGPGVSPDFISDKEERLIYMVRQILSSSTTHASMLESTIEHLYDALMARRKIQDRLYHLEQENLKRVQERTKE